MPCFEALTWSWGVSGEKVENNPRTLGYVPGRLPEDQVGALSPQSLETACYH